MQLRIVLQFLLNNLASWREFSIKASLKRGRGPNWSLWTPCTGIVTDQSLPQLPVDMMHKFVNMSPSPYTWVFFGCILYSNHCLTLCRNGCCQEESLYQAAGCYAKTIGRANLEGVRFSQPVLQEETTRET